MALKASAALVRAQYRSTWNRIVRSAGLGGKVLTGLMIVVVPLFFIAPGLISIEIGLDLGTELAESGTAEMLETWNNLQCILTVLLAVVAGFQLRPVFSYGRFGRYPVTPLNLLLAELPTGLLEPIPMLGIIGIVLTNVGLAIRMPDSTPLIMLLALDGLAAMLSLTFIVSALWAEVRRRRLLGGVIALVGVAGGIAYRAEAMGIAQASSFAQSIPVCRGYRGLLAVRSEATTGLLDIALATASSALLVIIAAHLHRRRLMTEVSEGNGTTSRGRTFSFGTVSSGVARLSLKQLLASTSFRVHFIGPLLLTGSLAAMVWTGRRTLSRGETPDVVVAALLRTIDPVPWFALLPLLVIVFGAEIWMNQFGLDRKGLITLLSLPIDSRDIVVGKLRALFTFTLAQTLLGSLPLLYLRSPRATELIIALFVLGIELLVTWVVGMVVSIRFPQAIDGDFGRQIPLYLSWIPLAAISGTVAEMLGVYAIGELVATGGGIAALAASLGLVGLALQTIALPRLADLLDVNRERLLSM